MAAMAEEEVLAINLKILSPSAEVEGGVSLPNLPASTTIRELRSRIQDAVPSKPTPDRMRLIYRGRVVANDADTLGHVFGAESIRESKEQSLHLVLRELPPSANNTSPSPAPRSSTAPPNPFRPAQPPSPASPALQTNPFRSLPQPRPNSQPQVAPQPHAHAHAHPHHHHHVVHQHHLHGPPNPFQLPLPPAIQQHLAQTMGMGQGAPVNNAQPVNPPNGGANEGAPAPTTTASPPPMGLPPLQGFAPPNLPPNGRTVRQEGIGPNGERWSVTYSSASIPPGVQPQQPNLTPSAVPLIPSFGTPPPSGDIPARPTSTESRVRVLNQLRMILTRARHEMENVRTLLQAPELQGAPGASAAAANPPLWRLEHLRHYISEVRRALDLVDRGIDAVTAESANDPDAATLRQSTTQLRAQLDNIDRLLPTQGTNQASGTHTIPTASTGAPNLVSNLAPPVASSIAPGTAPQTLPAGHPEELFLLSSPQGPVGILFNQQGTYMTAPIASTLPFQTFTEQFARNRQIISGLGQHIAQRAQLQQQLVNLQPTPTATQPIGNQAAPQQQQQDQPQQQNQVQNRNQNADQVADPQADNDRIGNIAGHLWLLFKLACFVYFFSGGGGWYKSIALGLIAGGVYLTQLGIFDEPFAVIRRHFEAVLPVGALAERAVQNRNANQAQRNGAGRNLTPEEAARRLLQQQNNQRFGWVRESMRTVERSLAIFVASLWPGIGERMVHAQEERDRAERVVEEERSRQAEEAQRQEAEAQQQQDEQKADEKAGGGGAGDESASSPKGKEKADAAHDEATSPAQAS